MHKLTPPPNNGVIGHRGIAGLRPENTYCSFKYAADMGCNWIEFDVRLTKDAQWAVMHDETIDRTTNGQGRVQDYTLAELNQFEAGLWFDPPYPREPIPTLKDTLLLCQSHRMQANIEIKGAERDPIRHAQLMAAFLTQHAHLLQPPMLSSYERHCLIMLRSLLPSYPIAYLIDQFAPDTMAICHEYSFNTINCDAQKFTKANLSDATENEIPILLYTINDPVIAKAWIDAGVTAVFSDRPDLLLDR
jgi:glycerophosphoryl diester phosphodiesterase